MRCRSASSEGTLHYCPIPPAVPQSRSGTGGLHGGPGETPRTSGDIPADSIYPILDTLAGQQCLRPRGTGILQGVAGHLQAGHHGRVRGVHGQAGCLALHAAVGWGHQACHHHQAVQQNIDTVGLGVGLF